MTDRELKAVAVGIITYCYIEQTGTVPCIDGNSQIMETSAVLDNAIFDKVLEICSMADMDSIELFQGEDE